MNASITSTLSGATIEQERFRNHLLKLFSENTELNGVVKIDWLQSGDSSKLIEPPQSDWSTQTKMGKNMENLPSHQHTHKHSSIVDETIDSTIEHKNIKKKGRKCEEQILTSGSSLPETKKDHSSTESASIVHLKKKKKSSGGETAAADALPKKKHRVDVDSSISQMPTLRNKHQFVNHPDIEQMDASLVGEWFQSNSIVIEDRAKMIDWRPIMKFEQSGLSSKVLEVTRNFDKPTPIQRFFDFLISSCSSACWPIILSRRDVVGVAETGFPTFSLIYFARKRKDTGIWNSRHLSRPYQHIAAENTECTCVVTNTRTGWTNQRATGEGGLALWNQDVVCVRRRAETRSTKRPPSRRAHCHCVSRTIA